MSLTEESMSLAEDAVIAPTPEASPKLKPVPALEDDTFYTGALKRTGTLYEGAKVGMLKRTGTVSEAVSGGLKRTGTLLGGAREGFVQRSASIREAAGQSLQRTGTVLDQYKQGVLKRSGTVGEDARAGIQRTGTLLASARDGALERAGSFGEWAQQYARGIYDPDRPMKATFQEIVGVSLPRAGHTISVISGRAYVFGGEDEKGALADNSMHVIILPSSGVLEADYKTIAARSVERDADVPAPRKGHTAVVVGDDIYIFGGQTSEKAKEEGGRVWVFHTLAGKWSYRDAASDAPYAPPRTQHAATVSEQPGAPEETDGLAIQNPTTPHRSPPSSGSHGTIFIYGGVSPSNPDQPLNDAWAFDIADSTWLPLPPPPAPARPGASLVLSGTQLYRAGGKTDPEHILELDSLDVTPLLQPTRASDKDKLLASLLHEWEAHTLSAPLLATQPSLRLADPGDGRPILLSIQPAAKTVTAVDLSPPPAKSVLALAGTASSIQDAEEDGEGGPEPQRPREVQTVQVQYADYYGDVVRGSLHHSVEAVAGWACDTGSQVEEAGLVVWGGRDARGEVLGSGWLIVLEK